MKDLEFRKLRANEIELRVGATTESGFSLLLYKTARVDANILDETVGEFNWTKRFYQVKNTMICEVGINVNYNDPNKEPRFVAKGDAGDESNTEAIKGEASDSFKRAGFAWGIGRELYTSPFIWVKKDQDNDPKKSRYEVQEIEYQDNEISKLVIVNEKTGQVVFTKGSKRTTQPSEPKPQKRDVFEEATQGIADSFLEESEITQETKDKISSITGKYGAEKYSNFKLYLAKTFGVESIGDLSEKQGQKLLNVLGGK